MNNAKSPTVRHQTFLEEGFCTKNAKKVIYFQI